MAWRELRPHQLAERDGHVFLKTHLRVFQNENLCHSDSVCEQSFLIETAHIPFFRTGFPRINS